MTSSGPDQGTDHLFSSLEQQAKPHGLKTLRLRSGEGECLGLLLLRRQAPAGAVHAALRNAILPDGHGAAARDGGAAAACPDLCDDATGLPGPDRFKALLAAELDRVERTRLPCSLLLVAVDGLAPARDADEHIIGAIPLVAQHLHRVDVFARFDRTIFSIALPGTNLGKALQRAATIRNSLTAEPDLPGGRKQNAWASIGIAVCHATDQMQIDTFLGAASRQLDRARKKAGGDICHAAQLRTDDACQVTVEERAQLFSLLIKE